MICYELSGDWYRLTVERTLGVFIWRVTARVYLRNIQGQAVAVFIERTVRVFALFQSGAFAQAIGILYDAVNETSEFNERLNDIQRRTCDE